MFNALARPLASLLAFFYSLVPSYMAAIVLLTLAIMLLLTPLTVKSTRSMLAMQRLQPEIKRLQQQHKNDRQALNEAMMAFYKEHNVNPVGGCLPMLLQMPVFFALYEAIRGLTHNPPKVLDPHSDLFKAVCPHPRVVGGKVVECLTATGQHATITLKSFGMDLAKTVLDDHGSFAKALPFYILIALTTATQYYQQRQLNNRNPSAAAANPQLQMTQKLFPIIFLFIYVRIPAAIVVYFLVSNLLRIGQQGAMWRWDPKLKAEVASEVREVESKTKSIEAKAKQVPNKAKGGATRPDGKAGPPAGKPPAKGAAKQTPPPKASSTNAKSAADAKPDAKTPPKDGRNGQPAASPAGRPNVSKPNRAPQPPRQQRGRRGR